MRRRLPWLLLLAAAVAGLAVWRLGAAPAPAAAPTTVEAQRGDLVVTVGGVGRIVPASALLAPAAAAGSQPPAGAVAPRAAGRVARLLVAAGQRVRAGQAVARIDDDGAAAAAVAQARGDLATARLELRARRAGDPSRGRPPTQAELDAAALAIASAQARLRRLLGPPRRAAVASARAEVRRAEAAVVAAEGGRPALRAALARAARRAVEAAQDRVRRLRTPVRAQRRAADADVAKASAELAALHATVLPTNEALAAARGAVTAATRALERVARPPDAVAVGTARLELARAQAELAALQAAPPPPVAQAVAASELAVTVARQALADAVASEDPADDGPARLDLARAEAELATLRQPPAAASPEALAAAGSAVQDALLKLARAGAPADPADVAAARRDLAQARSELATLRRRTPVSPAAVAAARRALIAARARRDRLGHPTPAELSAARAALERAQAELRQRTAPPSQVVRTAARQARVAARARLAQVLGPPLPADVAAARYAVRRAEADLDVLHARVRPVPPTEVALAQLRVAAAVARVAEARRAQARLTVRAPVTGTVTAVLAGPGTAVDPTTPVASVTDVDHLAVSVELSEFDAARVRRGQRARVAVDALGGRVLPGTVGFVALVGSDTGGVVSFPVRVGLRSAAGVKPGMNASVRIIVARRRHVVQVPLEAVTRQEGEPPTVGVLAGDGRTVPREVWLGQASNQRVEVIRGLRAGERVVLPAADGQGEE